MIEQAPSSCCSTVTAVDMVLQAGLVSNKPLCTNAAALQQCTANQPRQACMQHTPLMLHLMCASRHHLATAAAERSVPASCASALTVGHHLTALHQPAACGSSTYSAAALLVHVVTCTEVYPPACSMHARLDTMRAGPFATGVAFESVTAVQQGMRLEVSARQLQHWVLRPMSHPGRVLV